MLVKKNFLTGTSGSIEPATITRLLVVSFFIALSLGLIEGCDVRLLASPFIAAPYDAYIMHAMVLGLSLMILIGFMRRRAALVLALIVFWTSYMMLFAGGDVSAFWRDLALIGGLIMSANNTRTQDDNVQEKDHSEVVIEFVRSKPTTKPAALPNEANAYREDFNMARSY